jgi:transposase-like protein
MRWTPKRKARVVVAIEKGEMSASEAKERYDISDEELAAWGRDFYAHGDPGLRATKLQMYGERRRPRNRS